MSRLRLTLLLLFASYRIALRFAIYLARMHLRIRGIGNAEDSRRILVTKEIHEAKLVIILLSPAYISYFLSTRVPFSLSTTLRSIP